MSDLRKTVLLQIAALRQTIDAKVLERAKMAVFGKIPYDQEGAKQAVANFLEARNDGGVFRHKLEQALQQEGVTLDLSEPEPPPPPHPLKPRRIGRIA